MTWLAIAAMAVAVCGTASASPVNFSGTAVGSWDTLVYESGSIYGTYGVALNNDAGGGVADLEWGVPPSGDHHSSLKFDGAGSDPNLVPPNWSSAVQPFVVGTLNYFDGVEWADSGLKGASLDLTIDITAPDLGPLGQFTYKMGINNTINPQGDTVIMLNPLPSPQTFQYNGCTYEFDLSGFSQNNGQTFINQIYACEEASAPQAQLYGTIVQKTFAVPDGGTTILLLGLGMAGIAALSRFVRRG